jgi:glyoxylase-like metal-dependent hydrolase (beta-lactamase superfamily II)
LVDLDKNFDEFDMAFYLSNEKDLIVVRTPGHTWHHCSVLLKTKECVVFFGADICYSQQQLIDNKYSGANASHKLAKDTYSKVRSFCKNNKVVFIPSHEAAAADRLNKLQPVVIGE